MATKYVGSVIRLLLGMAGGAGLMSDGEMEQLAGAIVSVAAGAWGLYQKYKAEKQKDAAVIAAAVTGRT